MLTAGNDSSFCGDDFKTSFLSHLDAWARQNGLNQAQYEWQSWNQFNSESQPMIEWAIQNYEYQKYLDQQQIYQNWVNQRQSFDDQELNEEISRDGSRLPPGEIVQEILASKKKYSNNNKVRDFLFKNPDRTFNSWVGDCSDRFNRLKYVCEAWTADDTKVDADVANFYVGYFKSAIDFATC